MNARIDRLAGWNRMDRCVVLVASDWRVDSHVWSVDGGVDDARCTYMSSVSDE